MSVLPSRRTGSLIFSICATILGVNDFIKLLIVLLVYLVGSDIRLTRLAKPLIKVLSVIWFDKTRDTLFAIVVQSSGSISPFKPDSPKSAAIPTIEANGSEN